MPVRVFQEFDDEAGLARALGLAGQLRMWSGEAAAAIEDLERAAQYARAAGDRLQEIESLHYVLISCVHGPITVTSGLERAELVRGRVEGDHRLKVTVLRARAMLEAMRGNFDVARELIAAAVALADQLGLEVDATGAHSDASEIELLAGRPADAERALRLSVAGLERRGDVGHLATVAPLLADVLYLQGRPDEAMPLTELVARSGARGRPRSAGRLAARAGEGARPAGRFRERRAARARGDRAGRADATTSTFTHARSRISPKSSASPDALGRRWSSSNARRRLHEQKGNIVSAARTRALREQLSR